MWAMTAGVIPGGLGAFATVLVLKRAFRRIKRKRQANCSAVRRCYRPASVVSVGGSDASSRARINLALSGLSR